MIVSSKDIEIGLKDFESGKKNILLITGFSGSGKSTLALELAKKYNANNFELDCLNFYIKQNLTKEDLLKGGEKGLLEFIKNRHIEPNIFCSTKDIGGLYRDYIKFLISWCKKHKDEKFIIEGVQIHEIFRKGDSFITNNPIIIKGTSGLVSSIRAAKRNDGSFIKELAPLLKWALEETKYIENLKKSIK